MEPGPHWRGELRKLLNGIFRTVQEFDAFCLDYFPAAFERFSTGMDRVSRTNYLLQSFETPELILTTLFRHYGNDMFRILAIDSELATSLTCQGWKDQIYRLQMAYGFVNFSSTGIDTDRDYCGDLFSPSPFISIRVPTFGPRYELGICTNVFSINHISSVQELLDNLYDSTLSEHFHVRSYGQEWALVKETTDELWPILLPWDFICCPSRDEYLFDREWAMTATLEEAGILGGSTWQVVSLEKSCVLGLLLRNEKLLRALIKSTRNLNDLCLAQKLQPFYSAELPHGVLETHQHKALVYSRALSHLNYRIVVQVPL